MRARLVYSNGPAGCDPPVLEKWARSRSARERQTHTESHRPVSEGSVMPTVSAHVARTLSAHIDHVFGVMGNGNAYFLDALERETAVDFTAVRHEAGGVVAADAYHRASGPARRRHLDLRRRLHEHAHRPRRGGAGARAAHPRRRRRAHLRASPLGCRSDRPGVGGRRPHLHRGTNGCRGHHGHRDRARPHLPRAHGARTPLRRRGPRCGTDPGRPGAAACPRRSARAGRSPSRASATSRRRSPARGGRSCSRDAAHGSPEPATRSARSPTRPEP